MPRVTQLKSADLGAELRHSGLCPHCHTKLHPFAAIRGQIVCQSRGSQNFPSPERLPTPLTRDPPGLGALWPRSSAWGLGFCSFCYFCCAISVRRHSGCADGFVGRQERQRLITAPCYAPHFPFPLSSLLCQFPLSFSPFPPPVSSDLPSRPLGASLYPRLATSFNKMETWPDSNCCPLGGLRLPSLESPSFSWVPLTYKAPCALLGPDSLSLSPWTRV